MISCVGSVVAGPFIAQSSSSHFSLPSSLVPVLRLIPRLFSPVFGSHPCLVFLLPLTVQIFDESLAACNFEFRLGDIATIFSPLLGRHQDASAWLYSEILT